MSAPELQDIIGQVQVINRLQNAMGGDRLPHAFLFAGPAGVGRRTTAIAFAKTLLCQNPTDAPSEPPQQSQPEATRTHPFRQACGQCDSCRMMAADSHPDFHLIQKELARYHEDSAVRSRVMQELSIDVIRSFLIAPAYRVASQNHGKVFVVLEADLMSIAAQNSLLKTLEEPPAHTTLILISDKPDRLLPTTLSRCSIVRFGLLPREFVTAKLIENGVGELEANFWARFTGGSIGSALRLAAQGMYEIKCDIVERLSKLTPAGDSELAVHLASVADKLAVATVAAAKKQDGADLSKLLASRQASASMLELIGSVYRDALGLAAGAERLLISADQSQAIESISDSFDLLELTEIVESLHRYERLLWRNVNPKLLWDNVVIACASGKSLRV